MGNINQSNYTLEKDYNDPRFGPIKLYSMNNQKYLEKVQTFANDYQTNDYLNLCQKNIEHPALLKLLHYQPVTPNQIAIYIEFYDTDLKKEVIQRSLNQEYFNEKEIRYMFDTILSVCIYLQQKTIYHGDLRAQNIFITKDGYVKIADHGFINPFKQGPLKTLIFKEHGYISPELLTSLHHNNTHPNIDYFKSDLFTLGLTFLEILTLTSMHSIYNWNNLTIQQDLLQAFIQSITNRYSQTIQNLIKSMLLFNPTYRVNFQTARNILLEQRQIYQPIQRNNILQNLNQLITSPHNQYYCPTKTQRQPQKIMFDQRTRIGSQHIIRTEQSPMHQLRQQSPMKMTMRPSSPMLRNMSPQKISSPYKQVMIPQQPPVYCSFGQKNEERKPQTPRQPVMVHRNVYQDNNTKKRSSSFKMGVDLDKTIIKDTIVSQSNLQSNLPSHHPRQNMDDLEERIQKAIAKTQETISKNKDI